MSVEIKKEKELWQLTNAKIVSLERGSIYSNSRNPVIAFNTDQYVDDKQIKVIFSGDIAKITWNNFLDKGLSRCGDIPTDTEEFRILKTVTVNLVAELKEKTDKVIKLENPKEIEFNFNYKLIS